MQNKLYIVKYQDKDTKEINEYEELKLDNARMIYNSLVCQDDVKNLLLLEYDVRTQKYHIIEQ